MIIVTKLNRNGGQLSELDGTEWLYPPGAPSTEKTKRAPRTRSIQAPMEITKVQDKI